MKRILIIALAMVMTATQINVFAQDAKAKSIIDAATKKMSSLKSLKANFSLSLSGSNGKVRDTKKGTIVMQGEKYRVSLGGQEIICDNKNVYTYSKDVNEVQISKYNPSEQTISPAKLFTNFVDKEYKYTYAGEKTVSGKLANVIELSPLNPNKGFKKIIVMIEKSSNTVVGGTMYEKNGNIYNYTISGLQPNAAVSASSFIFNEKNHPGVEVVDLR